MSQENREETRTEAADKTAQAAAEAPKSRGPLSDALLRGSVLVALGAVVTTPLWLQEDPEEVGPTTFRAERDEAIEGNQSLEVRVTREIVAIIRTAQADEIVDENQVVETVGGMLAEADLSNEDTRGREVRQLVSDIVARAAEMDGNAGFSDMQAQAVQGTARMMARTLIANLGGTLEGADEEEVEGDWTPAAWPILTGFDYEEGGPLPEAVTALDGQQVMAWGYLINLDEDQYLLVQNLWSCCFGSPPDIHEAIVVHAESSVADQYEGQGVRVYGSFEASEEQEDGFVTSLYRLDARHLRAM